VAQKSLVSTGNIIECQVTSGPICNVCTSSLNEPTTSNYIKSKEGTAYSCESVIHFQDRGGRK